MRSTRLEAVPCAALATVLGGESRDSKACNQNMLSGTVEGGIGGGVLSAVSFALTRRKTSFLIAPVAAGIGRTFAWATTPGCRAG